MAEKVCSDDWLLDVCDQEYPLEVAAKTEVERERLPYVVIGVSFTALRVSLSGERLRSAGEGGMMLTLPLCPPEIGYQYLGR